MGKVANTFGIPMAEAQSAFNTAINAQTPVETAQNEATAAQAQVVETAAAEVAETAAAEKTGLDNVLDFIGSGKAATDQEIYREMAKQGVGVEQLAGNLGIPIDEATTRYTRAQEMSQIEDIVAGGLDNAAKEFPNGIPDNLLNRYASETNQSLEQIATNMDNFGVSVDDMSRATGIPLAEVQSAYTKAKGGGATVTGTGATDTATGAVNTATIADTTAVGGRAGSAGNTGLAGAERALGGGLAGAATTVNAGAGQARSDLLSGTQLARNDLATGATEATGAINTSTNQGLQALSSGLQSGQSQIQQGANQGLQALTAGLQSGQ